jgi:hypothetical protein
MTPSAIIALARSSGAVLRLDGDRLACDTTNGPLPESLVTAIMEHRAELVSFLASPPPAEQTALDAFAAKVVATVTPDQPLPLGLPESFRTTYPSGKPVTPQALHETWLHVAERILSRDFVQEPADKSTIESWRIGLRSNPSPVARAAMARLATIRPVKWRRKDVEAGLLLPRPQRNQPPTPSP